MRKCKHGHAARGERSRTYGIWQTMRKRCSYAKARRYHRYGGRGISVCARWNDYANFLADMGEAPAGKSIDRINNDGNYEPSNCRWATRREQQQNSIQAKRITFRKETRTVREWERKLGLSGGALWHRIKNGWTLERALTQRNQP